LHARRAETFPILSEGLELIIQVGGRGMNRQSFYPDVFSLGEGRRSAGTASVRSLKQRIHPAHHLKARGAVTTDLTER
jgi:hypothetical protein